MNNTQQRIDALSRFIRKFPQFELHDINIEAICDVNDNTNADFRCVSFKIEDIANNKIYVLPDMHIVVFTVGGTRNELAEALFNQPKSETLMRSADV